MKGKIKLVVGLLFATAVVAQAATIFVENFDNLDPTTDTTGPGSTLLGGQGQLEDITGTTWSGLNTDTGNLQTRVLGTGDRNLSLYTHAAAATPQINNTATFTAQDQATAFGFYFNLESWGTDNNGGGIDNFTGRTELGVRNSTGNNVFGIEMQSAFNKPTEVRTRLWDYTSGTRTALLDVGVTTVGGNVGSIGFAYDGAGNIVLTLFAGVNQTGATIQTVAGTVANNFSVDSLYIKASQNNTAKTRVDYVQVDDITVITPIPEPATLGLIAVMAGGLLFVRRRIMM
jgi:hypothetical protein